MKICSQTLSKIDQSSHTEGVYCKSLLRNMRKMGSGKNPSNKEAKNSLKVNEACASIEKKF